VALVAVGVVGLASLFAPESATSAGPVTVAIKPVEPFVYFNGDDPPTGYSIDLWNEIAAQLALDTTWVEYETVGQVIYALSLDEVGAGIAAISMTKAREDIIDFSHPYFDSGMKLMVRSTDERSLWSTVSGVLLRPRLLVPLLVFTLLTILFGHLVWLAERRHNPDFPNRYRRGSAAGMWWAFSMITVGSDANKSINRSAGRILSGIWMAVSLFTVAVVTGEVASALTVEQIRGDITSVSDLDGRPVATVEDTVAVASVQQRGLNYVETSNIEQAIDLLVAGEVDGVVFDAPILEFRANTRPGLDVEVVGGLFDLDKYGIGFPQGSDLRDQVNPVLLDLQRNGTLEQLYQKWFTTAEG
jgi:polar amino acid transport system substrate-binding protein